MSWLQAILIGLMSCTAASTIAWYSNAGYVDRIGNSRWNCCI